MKIVNLGHASFLIDAIDGRVVFDPYQNNSVPNLKFPSGIKADICLCSHGHADHNAKELVDVSNSIHRIKYNEFQIPHDKDGGIKRGMNLIRSVELEGKRIVHLGDIGIVDKNVLKNIIGCDVLFIPINGFFTISAKEAKEVFDFVKPRIIIPMHYENKNNKSGYPDGGQIEIFEKLFDNKVKVKNPSIVLEDIPSNISCIIFENCYQN